MLKTKKTKKPTKPKRKPISYWQKKADKVFSDFIRQRDKGICITCGKRDEWNKMQCGHYEPRYIMNLRYSEKNAHCQCFQCNVLRKGNYTIYARMMIERYGDDILHELGVERDKYRSEVKKYGEDFYKQIIEIYK